jgi:bifunctional UDP-N-acetylglucosamine pyrophosphorylase/glucosamine-1-phosphate N-acetyltransferase
LKDDVVLGVFTEVKNTVLSSGVRARHHSYLGDAHIGERVNIGAGTITANYDGEKINRTEIGDDSYIGSAATIVAPIKLDSNSNIESGAVVSNHNSDKKLKGNRKEV